MLKIDDDSPAWLYAEHIAKRSPFSRFKTGAVILDHKGDIISQGWAHPASGRMQHYYSIHAELHAISRAAEWGRCTAKCTCIIVTISGKSGNLTNACPCLRCAQLLISAGITDVIYTHKDGPRRIDLENENCRLRHYREPGESNISRTRMAMLYG